MAFLSGTTGFVKLGATAYAFGKWKLALKGGAPRTTNYNGGGYQTLVAGVKSGTVTCSGAYDRGSMPLAIGTSYVFHLGLDEGVELFATFLVTAVDVDHDIEGTPQVSVTGESTGSFTASIA